MGPAGQENKVEAESSAADCVAVVLRVPDGKHTALRLRV